MNKKVLIISAGLFSIVSGFGQTSNDVLNLLTQKNVVTQIEADSLRADNAIKQQSSLSDKKFKMDLDIRPRSEWRNGYQQLPNDTTKPAFFASQRSRLNLNFTHDNVFASQLSIQDVRVWGEQDPRSTSPSTLKVFEAWAEPFITPALSVRLGRQRLVYDNQRLFSDNNWRQAGVSHDALTLRFNPDHLSTDLVVAFNQSSEQVTNTNFKPTGFTNYKFLAIHYLKFKIVDDITITTLNSSDGFQDPNKTEGLFIRYTDGGRIEFEHGPFYATVASYYQWGKVVSNVKINAWYVQPEIKYTAPFNLVARLGAEVFSGNKSNSAKDKDAQFVPLYGSGHTFNGSMDLITSYPSHVGGVGLVDKYLFLIQSIGKKFEIRSDFHTFTTVEKYTKAKKEYGKYLGFENDWLLSYKPNNYTKLDVGVSYAKVTESFAVIKGAKKGAESKIPTWAYVAVQFKPQILSSVFK